MDWVARMNAAIDYMEEHLTEEIAYRDIAKAACCSEHHFQRMFSFMTDMSLSEYMRRRRLTLAAFELYGSTVKVVDLALKYGYDSPEAFTRAFQNMHGITPTAARSSGATVKSYPRMSFQLTIKGVTGMDYRIEVTPAFQVLGFSHRVSMEMAFAAVPGIWSKAQADGIFERLWAVGKAEHPLSGLLGVCAGGQWGKGEAFDYVLAVVSEDSATDGMTEWTFPATTWAVFNAPGQPEGLQDIWRRMYAEWLPASVYEPGDLPAIERYLPPDMNRNELWIPVVKKSCS
ncbi:AraC family transcriptional regulator [Gorillibacterium sp. sgz5001074]|uniref:AraC family transcriptional regulator n=1 Tax=Gorillibacterium sp. sgz5001074 TaxID=3446695 RepID=UPI003F6702E5